MAAIDEYLKKILSARYGKDVRQSIHDGIKAINEEVVDYGTTASEAATEAEQSATKAENNANIATTKANEAYASAQQASNSASSIIGIETIVKQYADSSEKNATNASTSEANAKISEDNAKTSETNAKKSETNSENSATSASNSAKSASSSATTASEAATEAVDSATNASNSASTATTQANNASSSASSASQSASSASQYASTAQNYAIGSSDSAKYYYEQAKSISESFSGALRPMGTVTFANLPSVSDASEGDMYNISDEFVTTSDFKEGAGLTEPAGSNIYKTSDGKWDILAGSPVTGVKGSEETSYRRGNVNITKSNVGLGNVPNVSTNNQTPTFTVASTRANIVSGEKLSTILGKIMKFFTDLKTVAFSGSYSDLSDTPSTATTSANGFMSSTDKTKLDGIADGANAYTHPSYTARTGVPSANQTPSFGGTFTVTQPVSDGTGHITAMNSRTITIPSAAATQSYAGLMSASDKTKLDGIADGAQVNSITGVKGNAESSYRTGNVNLTPANLGALPIPRFDSVTTIVNGKTVSGGSAYKYTATESAWYILSMQTNDIGEGDMAISISGIKTNATYARHQYQKLYNVLYIPKGKEIKFEAPANVEISCWIYRFE